MFTCSKVKSIRDLPPHKQGTQNTAYHMCVPQVMSHLKDISKQAPRDYDVEIINLIDQMLSQDHSSRPTAEAVWKRTASYGVPGKLCYCAPCCMPFTHTYLDHEERYSAEDISSQDYVECFPDNDASREWMQNIRVGSYMISDIVRTDSTPVQVVRKRVVTSSRTQSDVIYDFETEFKVLSHLDHRHIAKVHKLYSQGDSIWAIHSTPPTAQTLRSYLQNLVFNRPDPDTSECRFLAESFGCLADAVSYIHKNGIRHENIRPENVLHHEDRVFLTRFLQRVRLEDYSDYERRLVFPDELVYSNSGSACLDITNLQWL